MKSILYFMILLVSPLAHAGQEKYPHQLSASLLSSPYVNTEIRTQADLYHIDSLIPLGFTASYEYRLKSYLSLGGGANYTTYFRYGDGSCHVGHGLTVPVFLKLIASLPKRNLEYFLEIGLGFSFISLEVDCQNDRNHPGIGYAAHGAVGARFWEWENWGIWFDLRVLVTNHAAGDRKDSTTFYPIDAMLPPAVNLGAIYRF